VTFVGKWCLIATVKETHQTLDQETGIVAGACPAPPGSRDTMAVRSDSILFIGDVIETCGTTHILGAKLFAKNKVQRYERSCIA
jgi:hypothetical protein